MGKSGEISPCEMNGVHLGGPRPMLGPGGKSRNQALKPLISTWDATSVTPGLVWIWVLIKWWSKCVAYASFRLIQSGGGGRILRGWGASQESQDGPWVVRIRPHFFFKAMNGGFGRGITLLRGRKLTIGYEPLTNWDDPPSGPPLRI